MGSCFGKKKQKSNFREKSDSNESVVRSGVSHIPNPTSHLKSPSSPSIIPTNDLTAVYFLPSNEFKTPDDVVKYYGYELVFEIGRGKSAIVYKCKKISDGLIVACKILNLSRDIEKVKEDAKSELFVMMRTKHPHIISLYEHFLIKTSENVWLYLFMQMAEGRSLSDLARTKNQEPLDEMTVKRMFAQMVSAVRHMHLKGIAHRDLKMGNILLDKNLNIFISDFGLSRVAYRLSKGGTVLSHAYCGTPPYMAPEIVYNRNNVKKAYNPFIADIWALGVILYTITNKKYPFDETISCTDIYRYQMERKFGFSKHFYKNPSKNLIDLIIRLLEPNVKKRITIPQIANHPWIKDQIKLIPI